MKLFEIPTKEEVHDNIAAFWQPKQPLAAKSEHIFTYRLHWGPDAPKPEALARFMRTGVGSRGEDSKLFVLELMGEQLKSVDPKTIKGVVTAEKSEISNVVTQPNPGNRRVASELSMLGQGTDSHRAARLPGAERAAGLRGVGLSMDALNQSPAPRRTDGRRFLPPESPLSMVPCRLDRTAMPGRAPTGSTRVSTFRRLFIFLGTILLMLAGGYGMHDVVKVGGVTVLEAVLLGLFLVLLAWVVFSFMSALAGFFVLLMRRTPGLPVDPAGPLPAVTARTAMLMPTYNEDPPALCRLEMSCSPKRPQSVPW